MMMYDIVSTLSDSVEILCGIGVAAVIFIAIIAIAETIHRRKLRAEEEEYADRDGIYAAIGLERCYQETLWGDNFDDKNTSNDWCSYICRYATQAAGFDVTPGEFRKQMIKVAALAVAAIEATDRTGELPPRHYD